MKVFGTAMIMGIFLLASASLVSAASSGGDWTSFTLNNNNTGYQIQSTINASNVNSLIAGSTIQSSGGTTSTPIVAGGNVFFDDWAGYVYSANIATGALNWKLYTAGALSSTPEFYNGVLYVAFGPNSSADVGPVPFNIPTTNDLQIWAINAYSGKPIWVKSILNITYKTTGMDAIWDSPIIYNGLLYIGVASSGPEGGTKWKGQELALNINNNGAVVWNTVTTNSVGSYGAGIWSSAVIDPKLNSIYIGTGSPFNYNGQDFYSDAMLSLNATTGKINWATQICGGGRNKCGDDEFGATANLFNYTANGITYPAVGAGRKNGNYYIFDRITGALLENISVGTPENNNFSNGGIIGDAATSNTTNPEIFVASYYNGTLANGTKPNLGSGQGIVEAFYPSNGVVSWKHVTPGFIYGAVTLIPGAILFGDSGGNIYALSTVTGNQLFHTKIHNSVAAAVDEAEGYVLVPGFTNLTSSNVLGIFTYKLPTLVCTGTPSISIVPNPAKPNQNVNGIVSGLTNCTGVTVNIDSYQGCTKGSIITSFVSGPTGGNALIPSPGGVGSYGYWACLNGQGTEATLVVSNTVTNALSIAAPTPSTQSVMEGNTAIISDSGASGGTAPYTYQWLEEAVNALSFTNAVNCASPTSTTCTFVTNSLTTPGTYNFELNAKDSASNSVTSTQASVVVSSASCTGTPSITLAPNPATPSETVNAIVSGLASCSGVTVDIDSYQGCTTGSVITSFVSGPTGGNAMFTAPGGKGNFGYWACVNGKGTEATLVVSNTVTSNALSIAAPAPSTQSVIEGNTAIITDSGASGGTAPYTYQWLEEAVNASSFTNAVNCASPTSTTCTFVTNSLTTPGTYNFELNAKDSASNSVTSTQASVVVSSASCTGTPSITLAPNPATPSETVNAIVSGLASCSGVTVDIDSYEGCSTGSVITSFVSGPTGGNAMFTAPGGKGNFGYWACVNGKGTEATLVVSNTVTSNALSIAAPAPSTQSVIEGNTAIITDSGASGGTAPYTYQWLEEAVNASSFTNAVNCASPTSTTCTFVTNSLTTLGTYKFELTATDSTSNSITSAQASVVVSSAACTGTPSITLAPNPATPSETVNATVSGLTNCGGVTVDIDSYEGCATGSVITSFVSGPNGGSALFTSPGGAGSYGYWACVNGNGTEATLNVS